MMYIKAPGDLSAEELSALQQPLQPFLWPELESKLEQFDALYKKLQGHLAKDQLKYAIDLGGSRIIESCAYVPRGIPADAIHSSKGRQSNPYFDVSFIKPLYPGIYFLFCDRARAR
jgi:hypothetical protein